MRTSSLLLAASIPAALALPSFRFSADPTELAAQAFSSAQEWLGNAVQGAKGKVEQYEEVMKSGVKAESIGMGGIECKWLDR
jgi:hypothetical protein